MSGQGGFLQGVEQFWEAGPSAKDAVPDLVAALAGRDEVIRERIVDAIQQIDPDFTIKKVNSRPMALAAKIARLEFGEKATPTPVPLAELLQQSEAVNSTWRTEQELAALAKAIADHDPAVYRAFVETLLEEDSSLTNLFPRPAAK